MKRVTFVWLCLTLFGLREGFSQSAQNLIDKMMPKPVATSPNVAALGKFGDYQVSHFTGLPEVSIPIYEVQSGSLSIPITLSYHASGIKPTDVASWVGSGWSLSTGGQISRSLNGIADESAGNGYFQTTLLSSLTICDNYEYLYDAANGIIDLEPDVFSYSFPGHGGKFMLTSSGLYVYPYAPIKLTTYDNLDKFEIIDERGFINRFGYGNVENSSTSSGPNLPTGARSAWHLVKMVAPNSDDQITIDYQSAGSFSMHDISYGYAVQDMCVATGGATCPPETILHAQMANVNSSGDQMAPSTINFATGKVKFFLSSSNRADQNSKYLDRIEIQRLDGTVLKTVKFIYSYFTSPNGTNAALKLDAVQFKDASSTVIQKYGFDYFTNTVSWRQGNDADLRARDLWGYYNGATSNTDLLLPKTIPYLPAVGGPTTLSFGGATNRAVNTTYIKEGVLRKITFPTGGYTEFDFESNKYLNESTPTLTGGLRVTKITSSDGTAAPPIVKTFKYGQAESGYGVSNFWDSQFNYNTSQFSHDVDCTILEKPTVDLRIRSYQSNVSFSFESNPMMYTHVTEYNGDVFNGTTNGKTTYVFDSGGEVKDIIDFVPMSGKFFRNSLSWKRGQLTNKIVYDNAGNKLSETTIAYTLFKNEDRLVGWGAHQYYTIPEASCDLPGMCTGQGHKAFLSSMNWESYSQQTGSLLETSRTETQFQNGDVSKLVATTTTQTYHADKLQPVQTTKTQSAETTSTVNRYPFELTANSSSTGNAEGIYLLNQMNVLSSPIESYSYVTKSGVDMLTSSQLTTFRKNSSNPGQVVPDQIYLWEGAVPIDKSTYVPAVVNTGNNGLTIDSNLKPRIAFSNYDERGNVTSAVKLADAPISYSYGHNKTRPVAEVQNAVNAQYKLITATQSISFGGPTSGTIQSSIPITVDYTGTVTLTLGVNANPTYATVADYSGLPSAGSTTVGKNGCGVTTITFTNVTPGAHTLVITLTTPDSGVTSLGVCGNLTYPKYTTLGTTEYIFESFEENTASAVKTSPLVPHSGAKYYEGDFTISYTPPNARSYVVEYFYYDAGAWKFMSKTYTGTGMVLNEGTAIDNVRVHPADALMKTYTYDAALRMTSVTDQNNLTTYFSYDDFGRLRFVKDDAGNIVTTHDYHYKQ